MVSVIVYIYNIYQRGCALLPWQSALGTIVRFLFRYGCSLISFNLAEHDEVINFLFCVVVYLRLKCTVHVCVCLFVCVCMCVVCACVCVHVCVCACVCACAVYCIYYCIGNSEPQSSMVLIVSRQCVALTCHQTAIKAIL